MHSRLLLSLTLASAAALGIAQTAAETFVLEIDDLRGRIAGVSSHLDFSIVEYKDGDDPITHKRAGKAKYKNIVLKRGWTGESPAFDDLLKKVLAGKTDRKSGSVIYLDRAGGEVLRQTFGGFGDFTAAFPGTGRLDAGDKFGGFTLSGKLHLHDHNIIHRDLAARNILKAQKFNANLEGGSARVLSVWGSSPFEVTAETGDLDGDGLPDVVNTVRSSNLTLLLGPEEGPFVQEWMKNTEVAAIQGTQWTVPLSLNWGTSDGWILSVGLRATLISATPGPEGEVEVECATETVVFRPHRGQVK